jgi:ferric-dicitrate binding protein FerR (iron transport regulator)
MEQNDFREILKRYLSDCAPKHEVEIVEKWYQEMEQQHGGPGEDQVKLEAHYLSSIMGQVKKSRQRKISKINLGIGRTRYFTAIAASLLLFIVVFFVITNNTIPRDKEIASGPSSAVDVADMINTGNVARTYNLPDGSKVTLQPKSNLKVLAFFNSSTREVQLEGEAFFDITPNKDKPFIVYANDITTRVLGTSFTVRSYCEDKQVKVVVRTGKVSVVTSSAEIVGNSPKEIVLTPNQQMVYDRAEKVVERRIVETPEPIVADEEIASIRFEEAPLQEIVEAVEKIYEVNIDYDETKFATCTLTTSLSGRGLFNRMNIITSAIGATYELKEDRILIRGTGCSRHQK